MKGRVLPALVSALFCALILLPLLCVNREQGKLSQSENRYLQSFPDLRDEQGRFRLSRVLLIENWLDDNIGFRDEATRLSARAELGAFSCSPSAQVYVGRDGWYYYTANDNMEIAYGGCRPDGTTLEEMAAAQTALREELASRGADYMLVLTPSKVSVYPEYIGGEIQPGESPVDTVADYLRRSGLSVVNTKAALLEGKAAGRQVYYKTDSHWNEYGSYLGYTAVAKALGDSFGVTAAPTPISVAPCSKQGDLVRLMGAESFLPREETETVTLSEAKAVQLPDDPLAAEISALYEGAYDEVSWQGEPKIFRNQDRQGTALILGDSFFNGFGARTCECIAESYGLTVQVQTQTIRPELLELVEPDIVIFEMTERLISGLRDYPIQQ